MGFCKKCKEFVSPDFMYKSGLCEFCHRDQNVIIDDNGTIYIKQEIVEDYKVLLNKLKDVKSIKDIQLESIVKKNIE